MYIVFYSGNKLITKHLENNIDTDEIPIDCSLYKNNSIKINGQTITKITEIGKNLLNKVNLIEIYFDYHSIKKHIKKFINLNVIVFHLINKIKPKFYHKDVDSIVELRFINCNYVFVPKPKYLNNLTELYLDNTKKIDLLNDIQNITRLTVLNIDIRIIKDFYNMIKITHLTVNDPTINFREFTKLKSLTINNTIRDYLVLPSSLTYLNLMFLNNTKNIIYLKDIKIMYLTLNLINEKNIPNLLFINKLTKIKFLTLCNSNYEYLLNFIDAFNKIKSITLKNCPNINFNFYSRKLIELKIYNVFTFDLNSIQHLDKLISLTFHDVCEINELYLLSNLKITTLKFINCDDVYYDDLFDNVNLEILIIKNRNPVSIRNIEKFKHLKILMCDNLDKLTLKSIKKMDKNFILVS